MKKTNNILIAALAGIALSVFTGSAQAQYQATGDDGITASPKYRQFLNENRPVIANNKAVPADYKPMSCTACKDKVTERVDYSVRGANKPTIRVVTHLCKGCGTDWTVVGHGKAKQSVASHKCTSCGAETLACCNTSKGSVAATKGMEKTKDVDIAPLK